MKLSEVHRPKRLADVVGQRRAVKVLTAVATDPEGRVLLLTGPTGVGKTTSALALAAELGSVSEWTGRTDIKAADLTVDRCRTLERDLQYRPMHGGLHVVIVEELEKLSGPAVTYLQNMLEFPPKRCLFIACSNDIGAFPDAFLDRFQRIPFADGVEFQTAAEGYLLGVVRSLGIAVADLPGGFTKWGFKLVDGIRRYSLRRAIDSLDTWTMEGGTE